MNYRIRKNGGKIYMAEDIKFTYYCRDSIKGIINMAIKNGRWNVITKKLCPGAMGLRHFVPFVFLLSIIIMPLLIMLFPVLSRVFFMEISLYLLLNLFFSIKTVNKFRYILLLFVLFPIFHISYGLGSLVGLFYRI